MENLLYTPRELGVKKFNFDIGDIVYYHFTGRVENDAHRSGFGVPHGLPMAASFHGLVVDFVIGEERYSGQERNVQELQDDTRVVVKQITTGNVIYIEKPSKYFLEKKLIENPEYNYEVVRYPYYHNRSRYIIDPNDPGKEVLTYKVFKVSNEDRAAFERVMQLTDWFMDARVKIRQLEQTIRSNNRR